MQHNELGDAEFVEAVKEDPIHIYIIGRAPRIGVVPETFRFTRTRMQGEFFVQDGGEQHRVPFDSPHQLDALGLRIESAYPYSTFRIVTPDGAALSSGLSAQLMRSVVLGVRNEADARHLDFEVLYVGQAYGEDGSRTAPDRLKEHSTLLKIYVEAARERPDMDVWLYLPFLNNPIWIANMDGRVEKTATTAEEDSAHASAVLEHAMSQQQIINFTEAALIRYFQPPYNETYKRIFPSPGHKTYRDCYDLDLNMVCAELQTEGVLTRLWSAAVPPAWMHFAQFALHSREDRVSILNAVVGEA